MDYKTTVLTTPLKVEDIMLPDINGLYFGGLAENKIVFDYTRYFEENEIPAIDYKVFMRTNKHYIEQITKTANRNPSELFYQNTDGHILIISDLVFVCVAFVNPEMLAYFNSLLFDAMTDGVAYSHGFAYSIAATRLPSDILADIIKERETDDGEQQ